ncbi:MAG: hypothetical protein ACRD1C_11645 [Terriglobales bacterium]
MRLTYRVIVLVLLAAGVAGAQSFDLAGGAGTAAGGGIGGGFWPSVSATAWPLRYVGINGAFALRAGQENHQGFNFEPLVVDINLAVRPVILPWTPTLLVGWAAVQTVTGFDCPAYSLGPCFMSLDAFALHLGVEWTHYVHGRWFVQLEYHYYHTEFHDGNPSRVAVSFGHTFGRMP